MALAMIVIMLLTCGAFLAFLIAQAIMKPVKIRRERRRYAQWKAGQRPSYL